jgi:hypothetical protein
MFLWCVAAAEAWQAIELRGMLQPSSRMMLSGSGLELEFGRYQE